MNFTYLVYGLRVVADVVVPGLEKISTAEGPDLRVWLGSNPPWLEDLDNAPETLRYVTPEREDCSRPALTVHELGAGEYFRLPTPTALRLFSTIWPRASGPPGRRRSRGKMPRYICLDPFWGLCCGAAASPACTPALSP